MLIKSTMLINSTMLLVRLWAWNIWHAHNFPMVSCQKKHQYLRFLLHLRWLQELCNELTVLLVCLFSIETGENSMLNCKIIISVDFFYVINRLMECIWSDYSLEVIIHKGTWSPKEIDKLLKNMKSLNESRYLTAKECCRRGASERNVIGRAGWVYL